MISTYVKPLRLGYDQAGGATSLRIDEVGNRLLILGGRADEMAALTAYAGCEAGLKPLILDAVGGVASLVSGYFSYHRLADVLYDLYRMDENNATAHGELVSSAYAAALDLTFEEEAILDAAMQQIAARDNIASPPVIYDALSGVEGFRGFYVDKLKGRIGTLKCLEAADSTSVAQLLAQPDGAIIDLSGSGMPRAAEVGATLFIAKLVASVGGIGDGVRPGFVLVNGAHRVFKALPKTMHGSRLLTEMLESGLISIFASDQIQALSSLVVEACRTRILSADTWNQFEREKRRWGGPRSGGGSPRDRLPQPASPLVLPNSFVLQHGFYGSDRPFVARPFEARPPPKVETAHRASPDASSEGPPGAEAGADPALTRRILEEVKANDSPSMLSMASYLSAEFPKYAVQAAIDGLEKGGFLKLVPKSQRSGRTMLTLQITQEGTRLLGRLV